MKLVEIQATIQSIKDTLPQVAYCIRSNFENITDSECHPMNPWGTIYDEDGYPVGYSEVVFRARLFGAIWKSITDTWDLAHCAILSHNFRDDSYGGPEGGCIELTCTRCGYGFHHTLY